MNIDRTELHNLAAMNPQVVIDLTAKWEMWAERAHVKPYPGTQGKDISSGKD